MMEQAVGQAARIVGINFLNARPLLAGLAERITAPFVYEFSVAEPASCARQLATGAATAALVPVATLPFLKDVEALHELGVACHGAVRSVLLVSRVDPERIATLAVHGASRSSVVLARLWLAERWGVRPVLVPSEPPLDGMLADADAAVIIGDPALAVHGRSGFLEIDLGQAWAELTGLPFVFALWVATRPVAPGLPELLVSSLAHARAHWAELLPAWASAYGMSQELVTSYLETNLHFELGETDRLAMAEFLRRAEAAGVLQIFTPKEPTE
jgi:chorismate dehydratase